MTADLAFRIIVSVAYLLYYLRCSLIIGGSSSVQCWNVGRRALKTSNVFLSFFVCWNRNRSAPMHELLSNNSLCVGQL